MTTGRINQVADVLAACCVEHAARGVLLDAHAHAPAHAHTHTEAPQALCRAYISPSPCLLLLPPPSLRRVKTDTHTSAPPSRSGGEGHLHARPQHGRADGQAAAPACMRAHTHTRVHPPASRRTLHRRPQTGAALARSGGPRGPPGHTPFTRTLSPLPHSSAG